MNLFRQNMGESAVGLLLLLLVKLHNSEAQITWGPQPMHVSESNDLVNQRRIHDLLGRAYFSDYGYGHDQHPLLPAIHREIQEYRQRVQLSPSFALGVSMSEYYFSWYRNGTSNMDVESVADAANLMYTSIRFSGCNRADLPLENFLQNMCTVRWPYAVMMYSELGRDFASRYLTEEAATTLENALASFDEMKRLPYYAPLSHWQSPYDINFNEAWFPGVVPSGPVWDKSLVPLALFLETNIEAIAGEFRALLARGLFERLHFEDYRGEGQAHAPEEHLRVVELMATPQRVSENFWDTVACREVPRTCALLASRPELHGCQHASASFARLRAGGRVKPHFGAAPKLRCHVPLEADPGARMSTGNRTIMWKTGEAIVFDDTFIRQDWHAGAKGDFYVLQVAFCHPCEESQRAFYESSVRCPSRDAAVDAIASAKEIGAKDLGVNLGQRDIAGPSTEIVAPFAASALWAISLPELAHCMSGIGERCPPDTQHGGANPLSALNTWNYALNNLRAALRYSGATADPALTDAIMQVQGAIQGFLAMPAIDHFAPIIASATQIFEAVTPWLRQQSAVRVPFVLPLTARSAEHKLPSNGQAKLGSVTFPLANGVMMPAVGFGTWKLEGATCYNAVLWALELGVRHIDTAEAYNNEAEVGKALRDSGVPRNDVFITTKATSVALGMADPSYLESVFVGQLQALQTDYVDVYMLHAAGVKGDQLKSVWQNMERIHDLGHIRALGVSNFAIKDLEELWSFARIKPVYVQNIFKVYKQGEQIHSGATMSLETWAREHNVVMMGYSVINSWPHLLPPLEDPHVLSVAQAHGKTPSQVLHRWALQHGVGVIPKASSKERIQENTRLFDFELAPAEVALLDGLSTLSESTHAQARPAWIPDLFGLGAAVPTGSR